MDPRRFEESASVMPVRMMPQDANPAGFVHGGVILKYIDLAAAITAMRHCRRSVVTVSIDRMDFLAVAGVGEAVYFKSGVNLTGRTSMEVGVRVEAEDLMTGASRHIASAYMTFVAMDENRKPVPVPPLAATDGDLARRQAEAGARRETRLAEKAHERQSQAAPPNPKPVPDTLPGAKPVSASSLVMPVRMMPQDANPAGNVHGGVILRQIDLAAAMAAMRHCRRAVVTSSIERMEFLGTGRVGEAMYFKACLNYAEDSVMEVGVRVESENLLTGDVRHVGSAYLTFTALDENRKPTPVPPLLLASPEDQRRNAEALRRRATRGDERKRERAGQGIPT